MNTTQYPSIKFGLVTLGCILLLVNIPALFPSLFPSLLAFQTPIVNCLGSIIAMVIIFLSLTLPKSQQLTPRFDNVLKKSIEQEEQLENSSAKNQHQDLVQLLSMLQKEGRLLDFVMQDISGFDEKHIAAAARYVHDHCGKYLKENFEIQAVHPSQEGTPITILEDNISQYEFLNSDTPAKSGILMHRGWKVGNIKFSPKPTNTNYSIKSLIAPAQVKVTSDQ